MFKLTEGYWATMIWNYIQQYAHLIEYAFEQDSSGMIATVASGVDLVANTAVKPIGSLILSLFCVLEMHKWFTRKEATGMNAGSTVQLEMLIVSLLKIGFVVYFLQNIDTLMWGVYDLSSQLMDAVQGVDIGGTGGWMVDITPEDIELMVDDMDLNFLEQALSTVSLMPVQLCAWICQIVIFIVFKARMIEILVLVAFSPLPLATLVHGELSQTAKNYIKHFVAVCIQGSVIMVVLKIYTLIFAQLPIDNSSVDSILWGMAGYGILLCVSLAGTAATTKKLTSAI